MIHGRNIVLGRLLITLLLLVLPGKSESDLGELVRHADKLRSSVSLSKNLRLVHLAAQKFSQSSKGIVIAAGGADQLANALATVKVIRERLECKLPIEVIYYGSDEAQPKFLKALEAIAEVSTKDAALLAKRDKHPNWSEAPGYLRKIFAVYYSSFGQLLYLDADNTPLVNPTSLFNWPEFKTWGNLFWPDYMGPGRYESAKPEIYEAFGLTPPWHTQSTWKCTESGQFLLDRRKHADVMEWILFLNKEHDTTYKYVYGDKDTFELAFSLAGKADSFQRITYGPRPSFRPIAQVNDFSHTAMLQTDTAGDPVFFHQVAGGKFYLEKAALSVPIFTSLGMTEGGLNAMRWDDGLGTLRLPKNHAVPPHDVGCSHLDGPTAILLHKQNSTRWDACESLASSQGDRLPLLPLDTLPDYISDSIRSLLHHFHVIQREWYSPNSTKPR